MTQTALRPRTLKRGTLTKVCKLWINLPALASVPLFCLEVPVVPNLHSATGLTVYQGNTKAMTIYQGNTPKIQWVAWSCLHVGVRWMGYAPSVLDTLNFSSLKLFSCKRGLQNNRHCEFQSESISCRCSWWLHEQSGLPKQGFFIHAWHTIPGTACSMSSLARGGQTATAEDARRWALWREKF